MKPILLVQDGRTWAVHVRLGAVLPRRAKKAFPSFSPEDTLILVKTPDGKLDFVKSGEGGKAAKFSKEDAKHLAHKIGHYKLDLGDMVFAYTEERPDRSKGKENEPARDPRRGFTKRSRRDDTRQYKSREELVSEAERAARETFAGLRSYPSEARILKARSKAFEAVRRADPRAGTANHPHAAYAHGIAQIAHEGVDRALHHFRSGSRRDASKYVYKVDGPVSFPIEYHRTPEEALRAAGLMVYLSAKDRAFGLERLREGKPFRYNYGFSEVEITPKPKRRA